MFKVIRTIERCPGEFFTNFEHISKQSDFIYLKAHSYVLDIFDNWNPFKNDEKCFLFHLKGIVKW